jgi:hypothetical protein
MDIWTGSYTCRLYQLNTENFKITVLIIVKPLLPPRGAPWGRGWRKRPPDVECSCKYIIYANSRVDNRRGVVFQPWNWVGLTTPHRKIYQVTKCYTGPRSRTEFWSKLSNINWTWGMGIQGRRLSACFIWLRIRTNGGLLWALKLAHEFCERHGISWIPQRLLASQKGLCFMELVGKQKHSVRVIFRLVQCDIIHISV